MRQHRIIFLMLQMVKQLIRLWTRFPKGEMHLYVENKAAERAGI